MPGYAWYTAGGFGTLHIAQIMSNEILTSKHHWTRSKREGEGLKQFQFNEHISDSEITRPMGVNNNCQWLIGAPQWY